MFITLYHNILSLKTQHSFNNEHLSQQSSAHYLNIRNLQQKSIVHNFTIYNHINPVPPTAKFNQQQLKILFGIASSYFYYTLKVDNQYSLLSTKLKLNINQNNPNQKSVCQTALKKYKYNGFSTDNYDSVIATHYQQYNLNPAAQVQNLQAQAISCQKNHWVIYGVVTLITSHFQINGIKNSFDFHNKAMLIVHQLIHVYVFSYSLFNTFHTHYTNSATYSLQEVVKQSSNQGQKMIVTPLVKQYIQKLFNCEQQIGALLEDKDPQKTKNPNWDQKVFYDQVSVTRVSYVPAITELTLKLIADSNFFLQVNYQMAQPIYYGKNKGCNFALGKIQPKPQFCDSGDTYDCDFYNLFSGICRRQDDRSSINHGVYKYFPQNQFYTHLIKGQRCFIKGNEKFKQPFYYQANCTVNNKQIMIYLDKSLNDTRICSESIQKVKILQNQKEIFIECPDIEKFCARKVCPNWCNYNGLCVNGKCTIGFILYQQKINNPNFFFLIIFGIVYVICFYFCWVWGKNEQNKQQLLSLNSNKNQNQNSNQNHSPNNEEIKNESSMHGMQ